MQSQAEFDAQIAEANGKLDDVASAVAAEAQQVADWIAANPSVDTSALGGVVDRLSGVSVAVGGIFEPASESPAPEPEPAPEPTETPSEG